MRTGYCFLGSAGNPAKPSFLSPTLGEGYEATFCTGSAFNPHRRFGRLTMPFSFLQMGKLKIRERVTLQEAGRPGSKTWASWQQRYNLSVLQAANLESNPFQQDFHNFFISLSAMCLTYIWELFDFSVLTFTLLLNRISVSILTIRFFMRDSFLHTS